MLYGITLTLIVAFFTFGAIAGVKQIKRMLESEMTEASRIQHYAMITFTMWLTVIALFALVMLSDIDFANVGFTWLSFDMNPVLTAIVLVVAFLWLCFCFYRIIAFLVSTRHRKRRNEILMQKANGNDY